MPSPRKTDAEIPAPPPPRVVTRARMKPPADLNDAAKKEWRAIVNSLPADYFRPADVSLLSAYCVWAAIAKEARADIEANGIMVTNDKNRRITNAAVNVLYNATAAMAQMSVKLRLCPSARYDDRTAATKANATKNAARPWESRNAA
jgi:P27 family predicted phage terminase small subunit